MGKEAIALGILERLVNSTGYVSVVHNPARQTVQVAKDATDVLVIDTSVSLLPEERDLIATLKQGGNDAKQSSEAT